MNVLSNLNLSGNEIQNVVIHKVALLPASPINGMVVYLTEAGQQGLYLYKEGNWIHLGQVEALSQGGIQITPVSGVQYISVRVDGNTIVINAAGDLEVNENGIGLREIDTVNVRPTDLAIPNVDLSLGGFKITNLGGPIANSDAATKEYVDLEIAEKIAAMGEFMGDWSQSTFPTVGSGDTDQIIKGDWWRMSAAVTIGGMVTEIGDALFAKIDDPGTTEANWFVLQSNVGEATTTSLGLVRVSESTDLTTAAGANTSRVVRIADLLARTATTGRTGLIALATEAEALAETDLTKAITSGTMSAYVNTKISSLGYVVNIGDGLASSITITHNLGSKDVIVSVREAAGDEDEVIVDFRRPTINSVAIDFAVAPAIAAYRVSVIKVS